MKQNITYSFLFLALSFLFGACKKEEPEVCTVEDAKINTLQFLGSHNSFRIKTYQPIFDVVQNLANILPEDLNPEGWDYTHLPLPDQFSNHQIRSIELDVFYDPDGGLFYNRRGDELVGEPLESGIPELLEPGFKVLHIPDVDYMTHYISFKDALNAVKDWTASNPNHEPIFIMVEPESHSVDEYLPGQGFTISLPIDQQAMFDLDAEIKAVYGNDLSGVITPDQIRGTYASVRKGAQSNNWPTLKEARGKVAFIAGGARSAYLASYPNLEGAAMFVFAESDENYCAFVKRDNPMSSFEEIKQLVSDGFFVRTRSDADTREARTGDVTRREMAFDSGAQIVSTDYYIPDPRHTTDTAWTDFKVELENGTNYQLNPLNNTTYPCD